MRHVVNFRHALRAEQREQLSAMLGEAFAEINHFVVYDLSAPDLVGQVHDACEEALRRVAGGLPNVAAVIPPGLGAAGFIAGKWFADRARDDGARSIPAVWFYKEVATGSEAPRWLIGGVG